MTVFLWPCYNEVTPRLCFHFRLSSWSGFSVAIPSGLLQLWQETNNYSRRTNCRTTEPWHFKWRTNSTDFKSYQRWFTRNQKNTYWFHPRNCWCQFIDFNLTNFDNNSFTIKNQNLSQLSVNLPPTFANFPPNFLQPSPTFHQLSPTLHQL